MKSFKFLLAVYALLVSSLVWAHGEDKPGPHGGVIRMPGAFHTELVSQGSNQLKVYLLDINFKNPTVKDSKVELALKKNKQSLKAKCEPQTDFFMCKFSDKVALKVGVIELKAVREGQVGNLMTYQLPLALSKGPQSQVDDHSNHHDNH